VLQKNPGTPCIIEMRLRFCMGNSKCPGVLDEVCSVCVYFWIKNLPVPFLCCCMVQVPLAKNFIIVFTIDMLESSWVSLLDTSCQSL